MVNAWDKFCLLFWKNWLIQSRYRLQTVFEVIVPVLFSALLVVIRSLVDSNTISDPTIYQPFDPNFVPPINITIPIPGTLQSKDVIEDLACQLIQQIVNGDFPINSQANGSGKRSTRDDFVLSNWIVMYSPNTAEVGEIMTLAKQTANVWACGVESEAVLDTILMAPVNYTAAILLGGVVFPDNLTSATSLPHQLDVKLRFPGLTRSFNDIPCDETGGDDQSPAAALLRNWFTDTTFPLYQTPGPRNKDSNCTGIPGYYSQGFLGLQNAILSAIYKHEKSRNPAGSSWPDFDIQLSRFPYPPYIDDPLLQAMEAFVPVIIMLSFVYTAISTVRLVTVEKEKQLKEAMKMMGLPSWLHWTAWFVKTIILYFISAVLILVLLKAPIVRESYVLRYSDWSCVLAFLFTFIMASITLCFAISVFFSKANTAAVVSGLIWFLCYFPYVFMQQRYTKVNLGTKLATSLLSNTAMSYGLQLILMHEGTGAGLQWSNLWSPVTPDDELTMGHVMGFLVLDCIIYMVIAIYVEGVFPGEFGVPLPWYFPFQKSYWLGEAGSHYVDDKNTEDRTATNESFEKEPRHLPAGVQIRNLRKVYGKDKVAVDNLTLNMFEGQITVLLGHNGAGKTTTMSMLTGLYTPTAGTALVGGHSIRTDINGVRETLGLCPQHNVLFEELTVTEHLRFFGKLKGLDNKALKQEVTRFLTLLKLEDKANAQAKSLSGGMQRKLAAGVALCGHSKVVLFDEPTSGMDPSARRAMWDLLQEEKDGRTILLTTHFMDEADLLGDRIAIMSEGKLQCCGSSFFLKKKYGGGYYLVMVKDNHCDVDKVTRFLQRYMPDLVVGTNIGSELSYMLEEKYAPQFEEVFSQIEESQTELGILSFGVSLTTMEDVFIKVGSDVENNLGEDTEEAGHMNGYHNGNAVALDMKTSPLLKGSELMWNQIVAMFTKYATAMWRSWLLYLIIVLIPVIDLTIAILVAQSYSGTDNLPARNLTLLDYPNGVATVAFEGSSADFTQLTQAYNKLISVDNGVVNYLNDNGSVSLDVGQYILEHSETNVGVVSQTYILGTQFKEIGPLEVQVTGWFNNQPYHVPPLALSYIYNSILRHYVDPNYLVNFINHPLNYTETTKVMLQQAGNNTGFQLAFNLGFSFAFVMAFFIVFYIRERTSKAKLLQFVSGVNIFTFWTTAYIWNFLSSLGPLLAIIATLAAFQQDGYKDVDQLGRCFLLMILCVFATLPIVYLASFAFSIPATGFGRMVMINVFTGVAAFIVVMVLQQPSLGLVDVANTLDWVFTFLPSYSLTYSFQNLNKAYLLLDTCKPILEQYCGRPGAESICCREESQCPPSGCMYWTEDYFDWESPGVGRNIVIFIVDAIVLYALLILIEHRVWEMITYKSQATQKQVNNAELDSDVRQENNKIQQVTDDQKKDYNLLLQGVTKYYKKFMAVSNLNLGVQKGECFGLLGVNGAGKTTTFKMLTGDEKISQGDAYVHGLSLKYEMKQVNKLIGYCPQFDALIDDLTGRETMSMFCLLRGVPRDEIKYVCEKLAKELLFFKHIDKKVKEYSGGNKRKLSTAVALIGDPPVIYLDEPTTGMDPVAKRHLWNVICKVRSAGKTIVLTSHSMEECEALCTRLAIMVNGEFKCLGSTQHLKNKFAQGYTLTVKAKKAGFRESADPSHRRQRSSMSARRLDRQESVYSVYSEVDLQPIKAYVETNYPGASLREEYQELLTYHVPASQLTWSRMFGIMERAKAQLNIEDYSLGQTSLEQVFLSFTKFQINRSGGN